MYRHKLGARAEYRDQEGQRVKDSPSLAEKFRRLKSLIWYSLPPLFPSTGSTPVPSSTRSTSTMPDPSSA